jgi:hypothetical protein
MSSLKKRIVSDKLRRSRRDVHRFGFDANIFIFEVDTRFPHPANFSLSYEDTVDLIIGMYCDNNILNFAVVAKDIMLENDSIVNKSMIDFGLTIG